MVSRHKFSLLKIVLIASIPLGLVGCQSDMMPTAPTVDTPTESAQMSQTLRFSLLPSHLQKRVDASSSKIKTKDMGVWGGQISIVHQKTRATFIVPPKALDQRTEISMQVHGSGPSAVVEFGPEGLYFNTPALLALTFSSEGIDPDTLGGYLLEDDGTYTPVKHRVIVKNNRITILMTIPHFSEYTGNDDYGAEVDVD